MKLVKGGLLFMLEKPNRDETKIAKNRFILLQLQKVLEYQIELKRIKTSVFKL